MLGVERRQKVRNEVIRRKTRLKDIGEVVKRLKWNNVGHVMIQESSR